MDKSLRDHSFVQKSEEKHELLFSSVFSRSNILQVKFNIQTILPIALSLILPGLSLTSSTYLTVVDKIGFFGSWFLASLIIYIMWYLVWYFWDAKYLGTKWWYTLIPLAFVGFIFAVPYFFIVDYPESFKWNYVGRTLLASILFLAIQTALKAQQNISQLLIEKEQIQTDNYRVQLEALQAKIDPHFLFNSLNTLRSMVRQQHPNSEEFIMSLSDLYRQTLKHNENTTLQLSEELTVLRSYLFLMKSRNEESMQVEINIDEGLHTYHLPTLALQVVVENCFKHNSMTSTQPLQIELFNTEDKYVVIRNNVQPKLGENESSGFGLGLLRKRYELMNVQHGIIVEETSDHFVVRLKLI